MTPTQEDVTREIHWAARHEMSVGEFSENMTRLRQALAGADPLAALEVTAETAPFAASVETVGSAFAVAREPRRVAYLLRALDDAIAALEVAARLAELAHGGAEPLLELAELGEEERQAREMLGELYRAFAESQPEYQPLYAYRNALAAWLLRVDAGLAQELETQGPTPVGGEATSTVDVVGMADG